MSKITYNSAALPFVMTAIFDEFDLPRDKDGIYKDGSFLQHLGMLFDGTQCLLKDRRDQHAAEFIASALEQGSFTDEEQINRMKTIMVCSKGYPKDNPFGIEREKIVAEYDRLKIILDSKRK